MSKASWKEAIWGYQKAKKVEIAVTIWLFVFPVAYYESKPYWSKCGCCKHAFSWYYYFEEKPDIAEVFPEFSTRTNNHQLRKQLKTSNIPMFSKTCVVGVNLKKWLQITSGGGKKES